MHASRLSVRLLLTVIFSGAVGIGSAEAQLLCHGPDNLQGPCCTVTNVNLPDPLPTPPTLPALGICWTACQPSETPTQVRMGGFTKIACGVYSVALTVDGAFVGLSIMRGELRLDYTRTWSERNDQMQELQCWRFMAKANLFRIQGPDAIGCPVPGGDEESFFYYGYIDLALNCATGEFEWAICLFHSCDVFIHNPSTSSVPGVFHPQESYAIVAPVTPENPFVAQPLTPFSGPILGGGVRNSTSKGLLSHLCVTEEPMIGSPLDRMRLTNLGQDCACPKSTSLPLQYTYQSFAALSACGTVFVSFKPAGSLPWNHLVTASIGTWTGTGPGTPYPGPEAVWATEGPFKTKTSCSARRGTLSLILAEGAYGALTQGGFPVTPDADRPWQSDRMLDLATNFSGLLSALKGPYNGSIQGTTRLIYANF
ncbi:MAG: hypothetical protein RL885_19255 [Planctomycetota bacterium]